MEGLMKVDVEWAIQLAQDKLATQVPRRWAHTQHVVRKARTLAPILGEDAELLVAAAAVHDIGFSPDLGVAPVEPAGAIPGAAPGFPLFDAARYLAGAGAPDRLVCLVANHACGPIEGDLRGYPQMHDYPDEGGLVRDGLWFSCLTIGPDGQDISFDDRVVEWLQRYSDDPVMGIFTERALPLLAAAVERVNTAMNDRA
jgi:hypothetical protein